MTDRLLYRGKRVVIGTTGYPQVSNGEGAKACHVLEWERHHGPRPKGFHIHHKDGNPMNWGIDNLELHAPQDHCRLHFGWVRDEAGNWAAKTCRVCDRLLPLSAYHQQRSGRYEGRCRECHNRITAAYAREKRRASIA